MSTEHSPFSERIERRARQEIEAYREVRGKSNVHRSVRHLAEYAEHEYEHRFLIELIQNGCDAQPQSGDPGRILVQFDPDEGEFGCLYVANTGMPFSDSNFRAICDIANSDKPPGEGIGNKGVGFKSVLEVCASPHVYSRDPEGVGDNASLFDGYCFTFAKPEDILELCDGSPDLASEVLRDLYLYSLPVPVTAQGARMRNLAQSGYATVIQLPMKSSTATGATERLLLELAEDQPPLLLFLAQLGSLRIETIGGEPTVLSRASTPLPQAGHGIVLTIVDVGEGGSYLVAENQVDAARLDEALQAAAEEGQIGEAWTTAGTFSAHVAVSVPLGEASCDPRIYTYLPMGMEAQSPFYGHLHAPFFTKLSRERISKENRLNHLLLEVVAETAVRAALMLKDVDEPWASCAAIDLLAWHDDSGSETGRVANAFERVVGQNIIDAELLPILASAPGSSHAGRLTATRRFPSAVVEEMTAERIVALEEAELLDGEGLGDERCRRLHTFALQLVEGGLEPTPAVMADWAEVVASSIPPDDPARWESFYDDLARLFTDEGSSLEGKRILLSESGHIRPAGEGTATPFFPPRTGAEEDEQAGIEEDDEAETAVPGSFSDNVFFLHRSITWAIQDGAVRHRLPRRDFLENADLVRPFTTRHLLERIRDRIRTTRSDAVRAGALRWTYNLLKNARRYSGDPAPAALGLMVPTAGRGWVPATGAVFSAGWPGTQGAGLEELIGVTGELSPEIAGLAALLIANPDDWPFRLHDLANFRAFLFQIGVRDGLPVDRAGERDARYLGRQLTPEAIGEAKGLGERTKALWRASASGALRSATSPDTPYRMEGSLWFLPGQEDFERFSDGQRDSYSRQVIFATRRLEPSQMTVRLRRDRGGDPDPHDWPTPLAAFLREEQWVPQTEPGNRNAWSYARPREAWHFVGSGGDASPTFAPLLPYSHQSLIESQEQLDFLADETGLLVWDDPRRAPDVLIQLPRLLQAGYVDEPAWPSFSKAYQRAWVEVDEFSLWDQLAARLEKADFPLIVTREGRPEIHSLGDGGSEPILIDDVRDTLASRLLSATSQVVFSPPPAVASKAADFIIDRFDGVRAVSDLEVWVEADGRRIFPTEATASLVDSRTHWLPSLVGLIVELKAGQFVRRGDEGIRRSLARLRATRIIPAAVASVTIDGGQLELPGHLEDVIPVHDDVHPTIVFIGSSLLDWATLQRLSPAICELLGQPSLTSELRLALRELEIIIGPETAAPTTQEYAQALHLSQDTIRETLHSVRADLAQTRELLFAAIAVTTDVRTAEEVMADDRLERVADEEDLVAAIEDDRLMIAADELVAVCGASTSLDEVRTRLGIDLASFNEVLSQLGTRYRVIDLSSEHASTFAAYISEEKTRILDALRMTFAEDFEHRASLARYVHLRGLGTLVADPQWGVRFGELSMPTMSDRVAAWAAENGIDPNAGQRLRPLDEVRTINLTELGGGWARLRAIVHAWCRKHELEVPDAFAGDSSLAVQSLLDESGALDFVPLDSESLIDWLAVLGAWPEGMLRESDPHQLGIDEQQVVDEQERISIQDQVRSFERRSVVFREERFTDSSVDLARFSRSIRESVSAELLRSPTTPENLSDAPSRLQRTPMPGGAGGRISRPSESQTLLIGLAGEVVAFEWLKRNFRATSDESWISTYRFSVLGGVVGDDSLGFDFVVPRSKGALMFEVKATTGDDCQFELGQSEVRVAQQNARSERYRIIFIRHVLEEAQRRLVVLPNPFGIDGRGRYRLIGSGLKYGFSLPRDNAS